MNTDANAAKSSKGDCGPSLQTRRHLLTKAKAAFYDADIYLCKVAALGSHATSKHPVFASRDSFTEISFIWNNFPVLFLQEMERKMKNLQSNEVALTRGVVLTKAMMRAADRLGMSGKQLSDVIGLSAAQISRMKNGEAALSEASKPFELSALLVRVFRSLDAIVGGDERAIKLWMTSQNTALNGRPIDRMISVQGLADVVTYLDARRAPI
ncbi:antitoxin Xre/MbcA/ParS toxin-binding domain-containing protein [Yoonia sp. MH D7]